MNLKEYERNFKLEMNDWWFVGTRKCLDSLMSNNGELQLGDMIDIGCGTGANLLHWKQNSKSQCGLDISSVALDFCKERGITNLYQAEACALPFNEAQFDTVSAIGVIEHLDDDKLFLSECYRVLKPGGRLILLTSAYSSLWSMHDVANHHKRRYTRKEILHLTGIAGLNEMRVSYMNFLLFPLIALTMILSRVLFGLKQETSRRLNPHLPNFINLFFLQFLKIEAIFLKKLNLRWGISIIGVFKKPGL